MKRLAILLGLAVLASLVVSAAGQGTQGIRVFGEGIATVPADTVIISVGVQSNNANATLAAVADMAIVPVASGVGRFTVPPAPCDS